MLSGWLLFATALVYLLLLFAIASYGDRRSAREMTRNAPRPVIYSLSLAVYCTSWTYLGAVGLATHHGLEFLGIYIGPVIMFTLGMPVLQRIVALAKAERLTSIADFIAARYGKSPAIAALVAVIAVLGTIPYIALQLKAVSDSVATLSSTTFPARPPASEAVFPDISLAVTLSLALFAVIFGTRHTDATEHQDGLILAIATESLVKLVALTTVGLVVVFGIFDGFGDLVATARSSPMIMSRLAYETPLPRWIVLTVLSGFAVLMLPRQFHVTVVENRSPRELRLARILFPLYLVAINLFVIPVAIAGLSTFAGNGDRDLYVLTVLLAHDLPVVTLAAFLGGFSAATAMVIVASVAVAIMVSNDIVMPLFLRPNVLRRGAVPGDFGSTIRTVRRTAIFGVMLLGYFYYSTADLDAGLASIGLLSFAAIAQFAPPLLGGLVWRQANARGAIAGLVGGMAIWTILLFVPSVGGPSMDASAAAVLDFLTPGPAWASGPGSDPLVNAVILSLLANVTLFVAGSLSRSPKPLERIQAGVFIPQRAAGSPLSGRWRTNISVGELEQTVARYLGTARTRRSFRSYAASSGHKLVAAEPADMTLVRAAEQLLASAIGSASARLVLSLLFQKTGDTSPETARLLDEASEALQYNHDLLETALGQMDQGISVFDGQRRLTVWNKRFRTLLDLPESVGQVGFPLEKIMDILVSRGDVAPENREAFIRNRLTTTQSFQLTITSKQRIIEIRSNPMPDKGFVTTYADITERVAADLALKQANETLEARVAKRTAELTAVNCELKEAQAAAEEANIGKTRFLAAVGHDILQPLNAARLYSSSLVERLGASEQRELVRNIDSSLESVETILSAVLDLSRLDTGAMRPQISVFPLNDILRRVATDFAPIAHEKKLRFTVVETSVQVRSDPNLLRRLIQNLVSNAIKYTRDGRVLIGVRHRGDRAEVQVVDTGIGIPSAKFRTVFKEFARLDEGVRAATGLGLGLSIVDRIARVLNHPVRLDSRPGRGTDFRVEIPRAAAPALQPPTRVKAVPGAPGFRLDGLTVLCIDNEMNILEGMNLLLGGWGCRVMRATSVAAARELTEAGETADVIIADYHLDDGTGIEAIDLMRAAWGESVASLLITADRSEEVRDEALSRGVTVQNKPIRPAALRAYLNRVAVGRRSAAE